MQKSVDISEHIKKQKLHYKDSSKSICRKCVGYNEDCFNVMKVCGKDEKTGYSTVEKCGNFKGKPSMNVGNK